MMILKAQFYWAFFYLKKLFQDNILKTIYFVILLIIFVFQFLFSSSS